MVWTTKKKKKTHYSSPKKTTTTSTSSTTASTRENKKTRNCTAPARLSMQNKLQWAVEPTSRIILIFIKETFTYKSKDPKKAPINDFIRFYDRKIKKVNQRWLNQIIGSLTPFVTSLSSGFASQTNNISTSVSFFQSQLIESGIPSIYQRTKEDLITAVEISFSNQT